MTLRTRIIPTLLLRGESLVKTIRFGNFIYVGDPCNTVRIFNELEVDELLFLDITATRSGHPPNLKVLADIASECFMPLGYGGNIQSVDQAKSIFDIGFEKISINSALINNPSLVTRLAKIYGSQAIIGSIDVKRNIFGHYHVRSEAGHHRTRLDPIVWAVELESRGAGELLLTSIDREGSWNGFDLELIKKITKAVNIPVIAHGGAGSLKDIADVLNYSGASAVALGSMVVFQKKGMGVLVNFPEHSRLKHVLGHGY